MHHLLNTRVEEVALIASIVISFVMAATATSSGSADVVVFVYGTLKQGFHNHRLLDRDGVRYLGRAETANKYPMITDQYYIPYVLNVPPKGSHIKGELYAVTSAALVDLDKLENHPDWYRREQIPIKDVSLVAGARIGASKDEAANTPLDVDVSSPWMYMIPPERVTAEQLSQPFIDCYQPADHAAKYVPRSQRTNFAQGQS